MSDNINNTAAAGQRTPITFGTELEFIAIVPRKTIMTYGTAEAYVRSYLRNARVKLPCNKPGCKEGEHEFSLPIHDHTGDTNDKWTLTKDESVSLPLGFLGSSLVRDNYGKLELISRVQKFEGTSPCPTDQGYPCTGETFEWSWRDEMRCFLEVLHQAFTGPGFCLLVNETTGLHVHLGHGDNGLPVNVVQGLLGTMTALERSFDQVLPTDRINGATSGWSSGLYDDPEKFESLPGIEIHGFHTLYKPGILNTGVDFSNMYCPAISRTMFENLHNRIEDKARGKDTRKAQSWNPPNSPTDGVVPVPALSAETAKSIEKDLLSFNVPSWLEIIEKSSSGQEVKSVFTKSKNSALGLRGVGDPDLFYRGPPTAEVRAHAGSLDLEEISAWVDLLCSLARWSEVESKKNVFSYLLESWGNAEYNICTLARQVSASESTLRHYTFVLQDDYAQRRFERYTSPPLTFTDNLENLNRANEEQRRRHFSRKNVDEKIRWKLESGRYGPLLTSVLEAQPEPEVFSRPEAKFLHYNEESQKAYVAHLKNYYRVKRKLELTSKDSVDGSDASLGDSSSASSDGSSDVSSDGGAKLSSDSDAESVVAGAANVKPESSSSDKSSSDDESSPNGESGSGDTPSSDDDSSSSGGSDESEDEPTKSPVKDSIADESEEEFSDEGWYGLHPGLAAAYNAIPGQQLTYLENQVLDMPALPSPTTPNMLDFEELKTDTVARIHDAFFSAVTIESLAAAESKNEVENIIARAVESQKQMHVLKSVAQEKAIAKKYLNKKGKEE
ncbi:unnamed protein product [Aureobasidium mustum]|uniref:Uncharacterized protein n=1 Tax=Aureobasidium mustum TaxID=2773714 RepID=A0A9N8K764_9PEZI|nr:unnamed protein product [Aureobasidium mustum]